MGVIGDVAALEGDVSLCVDGGTEGLGWRGRHTNRLA